jgi:hypothetical protein
MGWFTRDPSNASLARLFETVDAYFGLMDSLVADENWKTATLAATSFRPLMDAVFKDELGFLNKEQPAFAMLWSLTLVRASQMALCTFQRLSSAERKSIEAQQPMELNIEQFYLSLHGTKFDLAEWRQKKIAKRYGYND